MGRTIAADHDLLLRIVQRVERVEELVLRAFLARYELDVVDQQHVHAAIARSEVEDAIETHGVDHLVHEALGRDIGEHEARVVLHHVMADRVHQVRLAEPDAAMNEQRVVRSRRRFRYRAARGVRELVRWPDDEGVEGVARNQASRARRFFTNLHLALRGAGGGRSEIRGRHVLGLHFQLGTAVGDKHQFHVRAAHLAQGLGQDHGVVLGKPFDEERVGNADRQALPAIRQERRRLEPGGKAVLSNLIFNAAENLIPNGRDGHSCN
jgi:hypothetical protein